MRIKQLELVGFKSFVDRTVLSFSSGISAIVGPNGCGKSNVVDAIRWVLGEQSAKHLRGLAMEDVIFKGNARRAPLGMAEVSLTLENDAGAGQAVGDADIDLSAIPAHVRGLPEVTISRRYYRSGESEYLINRSPCRMKDITELFLGTGVGSKAYAIIEQGRVEQLISAKPEDRRWFIEEAAGTTLYRTRKLAAERKMERTRENLQRVNDILREVERQIQYLHRQAKKAEQYRALQGEVRVLEVTLSRAQWRAFKADVDGLEGAISKLTADEEAAVAGAALAEADRARANDRVQEIERRLSAVREDAARSSAELEGLRQRAQWLRQEEAERDRRLERIQEEIEALLKRSAALAQELNQNAIERHDLGGCLAADEASLQARGDAVERQRAAVSAAEELAEDTKNRLVGTLAREAEGRNQVLAAERRWEELRRRIGRLEVERQEAAAQLREAEERLVQRRAALEAVHQRLRDLEGERELRSRRLRELADERRAVEERVTKAQEHLLQLRSRLRSLEEIQQSYEGYQRGVRSIMLGEREAGGVLSVVADVITAPREYERAVAAVLGERLQYVIVEGEDRALGAVQTLRAEDSGRGSFIPRTPRRLPLNPSGIGSLNGNTTRMLDLVKVEEGYRDVAEALLGDVVVVPNLPTALAIWRHNGVYVTMVTPEGDVLDPAGVVTGGSDRPVEEEILARRREIVELELAVRDVLRQLEGLSEELVRVERFQEAESAALREIDAGGHQLTLESVAAEKDCERLEAELPRWADRIEVLQHESDSAAAEAAEAQREAEAVRTRLADLAVERAGLERELRGRQESWTRAKAEVEGLLEDLTAAKVGFAERKERLASLAARAEELESQRQDAAYRIGRLEADSREAGSERLSIAADAARAEEEGARVKLREEGLGREIEAIGREADGARAAARREDECLAEIRGAIDRARAERLSCETSLAEKRVRIEHLESAMREKYGEDLAAAAATSAGELADPEIAGRLEQLRERLARIGEVNIGAIEELQELENRAQFLRAQKDDLDRSLDDLQQTINKLNRASRAKFRETFEKVDNMFRTVFPRLFRGGEARLVLTDEQNILESGVEIFVRPPGKKLDTVTLLSGGEKALVAVSLIFALFLINPTPFCFLDEVDAPLDDANVGRFVQMVREIRDRTQFVLITHNKRTMEAADCLYGVTMEEPGVSKVISVAMR